jgi:pyrimidine operon attenuation protein/uracil phosphoribosyltransferase
MPDIAGDRFILYDTHGLEAVLDSMARQAAALLAGRPDITLVGILRRGAPLSEMLHERLVRDWHFAPMQRLQLKIQRYSDDLRLLHPDTLLTEDPTHAALDLSGRTVLLIDDVLYRGHSLLRALDWLQRRQPAQILVAVLADRDVALLPLHADIVGLHLNVAPGDVIECHVPPYEEDFAIELLRPDRG